MVLCERTTEDLKKLLIIKRKKRELDDEVKEIFAACAHENYELTYIETLAFDCVPIRQCRVCMKKLDGITEDEQRQVVTAHLEDIELNFDEEQIKSMLKGWNTP